MGAERQSEWSEVRAERTKMAFFSEAFQNFGFQNEFGLRETLWNKIGF